jgi:hypothetical protein
MHWTCAQRGCVFVAAGTSAPIPPFVAAGILEAVLCRVLEAFGAQVAACLVGAKAGGLALRCVGGLVRGKK